MLQHRRQRHNEHATTDAQQGKANGERRSRNVSQSERYAHCSHEKGSKWNEPILHMISAQFAREQAACRHANGEQTTVDHPDGGGRESSHLPHGVFPGECLLFAYVPAEHARERPVVPRMRRRCGNRASEFF